MKLTALMNWIALLTKELIVMMKFVIYTPNYQFVHVPKIFLLPTVKPRWKLQHEISLTLLPSNRAGPPCHESLQHWSTNHDFISSECKGLFLSWVSQPLCCSLQSRGKRSACSPDSPQFLLMGKSWPLLCLPFLTPKARTCAVVGVSILHWSSILHIQCWTPSQLNMDGLEETLGHLFPLLIGGIDFMGDNLLH